jgi:O-antigen/teichoic acid export membrane protein
MTQRRRGSRLLTSLASNWLGLAVGVLVSFFLSPFVVNNLGAAWYGVWAVTGQFVGYLFLLDFGVRESVIRYTSKYVARRNGRSLNHVLSAALVIYSVITLLALLATGLAAWGLPYWFSLEPEFWRDGRMTMLFTGLTIAQTFFFNVFNGVVIGLKRWEITNAIGIVLNLLRAGLIVLFLLRGHGIVAMAAIGFGTALVGGLVNVFLASRLLREAEVPFRFATLGPRRLVALGRRILGYGFYVIVNNVGEKLITATDAVVVAIFMTIQSVAYYAIAGSLIGYLRALLGTSAQIFNPLASELHSLRQPERVTAAFFLGVKICTLVALPVAASFVVLGEQFIRLWMGPEFAGPSSGVLAVLAVATFLAAPQYVFSAVLYGMSRHRIIALLRIIEAVGNLVLSIMLVQTLGIVGVALGTAIPSAIMVMVVLPLIAGPVIGATLPRFYSQAYIRPLLAVVPFVTAAYWVQATYPAESLAGFFLQVLGLLTLYVPCAIAIVLNAEERSLLLSRVIRRVGSH